MYGYTSDLTPEQFEEIKPYLPVKKKTRPRKWSDYEMMNSILYVLVTGCQWRNLPKEMPPWKSVYRYFMDWKNEGVFEKVLKKINKKISYSYGKEPITNQRNSR